MSTESTITVDHSAVERILWLRQQEDYGDSAFLRIAISGGGCSGFKYEMSFTDEAEDEDKVFNDAIVIDTASLDMMENTRIAFEDDLTGARFVIDNPNVSSGCGCGKSFTVNEE